MVESSHDVPLLGPDSLFRDFLMSDLLVDQFQFEGIDLFIFTSHEHSSHSNLVEVGWFESLLSHLEVSIHVLDSQEERLILALVGTQNFDHPVDHFASEIGRNLVIFETISHLEGGITFFQVVHDIIGIVFTDVIGLPVAEEVFFIWFGIGRGVSRLDIEGFGVFWLHGFIDLAAELFDKVVLLMDVLLILLKVVVVEFLKDFSFLHLPDQPRTHDSLVSGSFPGLLLQSLQALFGLVSPLILGVVLLAVLLVFDGVHVD